MSETTETTVNDPTRHTASGTGTPEAADQPAVTAGAIFHATRQELLGAQPVLDAAEIARSYCAVADRVVSVVAITPGRIRRVDCWLGDVGFVIHAAADDPTQRLLGSVCDRARALEMTGSIVAALVGGVPTASSADPVRLGPVGRIRPDTIPEGADWIVIVSANRPNGESAPDRCIIVGCGDGTAAGVIDSLDEPVRIDPAGHSVERWVADLIGSAPRSVVDLLADD